MNLRRLFHRARQYRCHGQWFDPGCTFFASCTCGLWQLNGLARDEEQAREALAAHAARHDVELDICETSLTVIRDARPEFIGEARLALDNQDLRRA